MIEIKRNCSSSIRDVPEKYTITFGDFTIRISGLEYDAFDIMKSELKLKSEDLLQELIIQGLYKMIKDMSEVGE